MDVSAAFLPSQRRNSAPGRAETPLCYPKAQMKDTGPVEARLQSILREYEHLLRHTVDRFCPQHLKSQRDDIEQEARIRLWKALKSGREISHITSYVYRVAATATIDAVRKAKSRREELTESTDDESSPTASSHNSAAPSPERTAQLREAVACVQQQLATLKPERGRAVGLYLQGMNSHEIAALLGWTEPRARNLLYRGLKDLRSKLSDSGIEL